MLEIVLKPTAVSKLPPTLVAKTLKELEEHLNRRMETKPLRARQKSLEIVIIDGQKIGCGCHKTDNIVEVSSIKIQKGKKKTKSTKNGKKGR